MAEQNMLNRNIDNGDKLRKSALLIGADVMTAAHVDRHFEDGSINAAKIGSGTATAGYVLTADGVGGADWLAAGGGGGGAIDYDGTITNALRSTNATVAAYYGISIGYTAQVTSPAYSGIAIGRFSKSYGNTSIAVGFGATAADRKTIAIGGITVGANSYYSVAIGHGAAVSNQPRGVAIGYGAQALNAANGVVIGNTANVSASGAVAIGNAIQNSVADSVKIGWGSGATQSIHFTSFTPAAGTKSVTHSIPVTMNGATFHILLSNV